MNEMQITEKQLREQYERARQLGWLDGVDLAGQRYDIKSATLLAIASRETNLDPKYLRVGGDNNNGWGLCQADVRSYPQFVKSGAWRNADACFEFAAQKLSQEYKLLQSWAGKSLTVKFSTGQRRTFKCTAFDKDKAWEVVVAGYNCGLLAAAYHASADRSPDTGTTGKNYSADVFYRARIFAKFLASDHAAATAPANTPTAPIHSNGGQTNAKLEDFGTTLQAGDLGKATPTLSDRGETLVQVPVLTQKTTGDPLAGKIQPPQPIVSTLNPAFPDDWIRKMPPNPLPPNPISIQAKATAGMLGFLTMLMGLVLKAGNWLQDYWLTVIVSILTLAIWIYLWSTHKRRHT